MDGTEQLAAPPLVMITRAMLYSWGLPSLIQQGTLNGTTNITNANIGDLLTLATCDFAKKYGL
jgi:hypothetical protein